MKALRFAIGVLVGASLAFACTRAAHGGAVDWAVFTPFAFPGVLVAAPSTALHVNAYTDAIQRANLLVVDGVDFVVYSALFCWLLLRWGVTRE